MADLTCCTCLYKSSKSHEYITLRKKVKIKENIILDLCKMLCDCISADYEDFNEAGNLVCLTCAKKITCLYEFRRTCLDAHKVLRKEIQNTTKDVLDATDFVKIECDVCDVKEESPTEIVDTDAHRQDDNDCLANYDIRYDNYSNDGSDNFNHFDEYNDMECSDEEFLVEPEFVNEIEDECESDMEKSDINMHTDKHFTDELSDPESLFICDYCNKKFTKKVYLKVCFIIK